MLCFKNANFLELQPIFETTRDELNELRGGEFDTKNRLVVWYLGL